MKLRAFIFVGVIVSVLMLVFAPLAKVSALPASGVGEHWTQATENANWSTRDHHGTANFLGKLWVVGGRDLSTNCNGLGIGNFCDDVWSSNDGADWTLVTDNPGWDPRQISSIVVFDGKLWIMGGYDGNGNCNGSGSNFCRDVWNTTDGENWTEVTDTAAWPARSQASVVAFNDKLWLIGGYNGSDCNGSGESDCHDVWSSTDGITWIEETNSPGWHARNGYGSVVFNDKLWIIGGWCGSANTCDDVWNTEDGINWVQVTDTPAWVARNGVNAVVFDGSIWIAGGCGAGCSLTLADVWKSSDGINWVRVTESAEFGGRASWAQNSILQVFDNKLWVMGGLATDWAATNDVWYSEQASQSKDGLAEGNNSGALAETGVPAFLSILLSVSLMSTAFYVTRLTV